MKNSHAIQTLLVAMLQGCGALSVLFMDMLIARLIGLNQFGLYATIVSWVYILSILSTLGTNQLALKHIPEYFAQNKFSNLIQLLKTSQLWVYQLSISVVTVCFSIFLFLGFSESKLLAFILGFLSIPLLAQSYLRQSTLRALGSPFKALIPDFLIKPILGFILIFGFSYFYQNKLNALVVLGSLLLAAFVAYLTGEFWLKKRTSHIPLERDQKLDKKKWLFTSLNLLLVISLNLLSYRIDILMITILGHITEVGIYAAASKVAEIVVFGLVSSNIIVIPLISKYFALNDKQALQAMLKKISKLIFIATLPFALIIIVYAKQILSMFGNGFEIGQYALIVLVIGQITSLVCGPVGAVLMMTGYEKTAVKISAFLAVSNILLNLVLIPAFGMIGAAFSTAISLLVVNVVMVYYVKKLASINTTVFQF